MTARISRDLLSLSAIAATYDLAVTTVRTYNGQAAQRRRAGTVRPHDFPAPVDRIGHSPLFSADEVRDWFEHRPGRGAGGGRPPKTTPPPPRRKGRRND